ncbi:PspC domain-containing protein [[Pseudopropionibacterium] massiliense]|uniref:PspC domain-containing protein n=1 Tax=[Pseudopropionibacterium] massiliense TaxID=2220000 RepID=UPI0010317F28|nr:PspC domain-containing protein [[Pseudopropionibacterium] massiliense]
MNELVDLGALHPRLAHLDRPSNGFTPGFCRAIGSRFGIDPLLIRVLFILTSALSGVGVIAYGWGILLTPRAGRQALIHRLLPVFTSWSLRTQWTVIVLSSTLVVAAVSQMLSSLSSVLLLPLFALVLYSRWREPRRRPVSPTVSREQPAAGTDPQLPVVDLYAPETPEPQPVERVRCSWLGTGLVLFIGYLAATGVVVLGLLSNPLLSLSIVLGAVGVMILGWGLLVRNRRLPVVLLLLAVMFAGTTAALATSEVERATNPVEVSSGQERLSYQFTMTNEGVVDLRHLPADSSTFVHVRTVMSEVRIMLPGPPARRYVRAWAIDVSWPGGTDPRDHDPATRGIRLLIDGYLSSVKVEYPS